MLFPIKVVLSGTIATQTIRSRSQIQTNYEMIQNDSTLNESAPNTLMP